MRKLLLSCVLTTLSVLALPAAAYQSEEIIVEHNEVADNIYMLTGAGGNMLMSSGDDGVFLVDDQYTQVAEKIAAKIKELSGEEVRYILNTHFHGDHVGSNSWFANNQNSTIYAHDHVRERLSQDSDFNAAGLPAITFDSTLTFHLNNDTVSVFYLPAGHTDGDSAVWFEDANVLHPGDLFFNERFPFIDLESGGDVDGYIANVEELLSRINDDTVIIPGHGPLANKQDYQGFLTMLKETKAEVDAMKQQGMTLDEAKTKGLSDKWDGWSWSFINEERWITTLY
ncbi:MBL fold metallo-hydrolase [Idiomarina loihiensis]|uniref:MBL fold metallo-hydrolase n=1 Tax=Idiomarina loihiensis TaxID=135577 RepID=UPI00129CCD6C|nr:MBL fold metallo-hydrolase [Idiomarina loihiensis]MRJ45099.1 MBL fold metallo-hydrolase [Idiomarina loihiensis]UTW32075.1 MBL fold metallo-hydrolase [Idiomarina loihiensis]